MRKLMLGALLVVVSTVAAAGETPPQTILGVAETKFTINGKPTFLLGISYYGGLGAPEQVWRSDLKTIKEYGFNWVRLWANWQSFGQQAAAVDPEGNPIPEVVEKLKEFVAECDRQGIIVDLTLSRGNGVTGPQRLQSREAHLRAGRILVQELRQFRNWYLDLSNERNIQDARFTSVEDLVFLRNEIKKIDPERLLTASHAGDISEAALAAYLNEVRVDFISPHRPRQKGSPEQTEAMSRRYLERMRALGRVVPVHYQEPFRRDFGAWNPTWEEFRRDLEGAIRGGAAGWCFHDGDNRRASDGRPRRSFDLRDGSLFSQLDSEEQAFLKWLRDNLGTLHPQE